MKPPTSEEVLTVLRDLYLDDTTPAQVRLKAAEIVLGFVEKKTAAEPTEDKSANERAAIEGFNTVLRRLSEASAETSDKPKSDSAPD